jgi:hypothetical protein
MKRTCKEHSDINPEFGTCAPLHSEITLGDRLATEAGRLQRLSGALDWAVTCLEIARESVNDGDEKEALLQRAQAAAEFHAWPELQRSLFG